MADQKTNAGVCPKTLENSDKSFLPSAQTLDIEFHKKVLTIKALNRGRTIAAAAVLLGVTERSLYHMIRNMGLCKFNGTWMEASSAEIPARHRIDYRQYRNRYRLRPVGAADRPNTFLKHKTA